MQITSGSSQRTRFKIPFHNPNNDIRGRGKSKPSYRHHLELEEKLLHGIFWGVNFANTADVDTLK